MKVIVKEWRDPNVYPHRLRHFFATKLAAKGMPFRSSRNF